MTNDRTNDQSDKAVPRKAWLIPAVLSAALLIGVTAFLLLTSDFSANALGDFVGGVGGAIAFIWLIFGYFLQSRELSLQRRELALQRQNTAVLAEATAAAEQHAEHEVVLKSIQATLPEMYEIAHVIYFRSFQIKLGERYKGQLKPQYDSGDRWIFCRNLIDRFEDRPDLFREHWDRESLLRDYTMRFVTLYERLEVMATRVDLSWFLEEALMLGKVHSLLAPFAHEAEEIGESQSGKPSSISC